MASTKIPDPLSRRFLLEREVDPAKARALAEAYLAEGREIEALDFLTRAGDRERLEGLRGEAIERGDVFLLRAASHALDEEPDTEAWSRLRDAAVRAGRESDAETAARLAAVEG